MRSVMAAAALAACVGLAGCQTAKITLLPNEDGKGAGAVAVLDPKTEKDIGELSQADYEAKTGKWIHKVKPRKSKRSFANLFGLMPAPPVVKELKFETGTTVVAAESQGDLEKLLNLWERDREISDIEIIGYTDTVGSEADNDALSLKRAEAVRDMLANQGFKFTDDNSHVIGRGERELAKPTADEVDEPMNRRVVVVIR